MVRPSNSKLMSKVLEAVTYLGESKGSSVRDILQLVKKGSNGPNRNLTMQVQRALKRAVAAGILKHRNGRYKAAISLVPVTQPHRHHHAQDDYAITEDLADIDPSTNGGAYPFGEVQDRRRQKRPRSRRRRRGSKRRRGKSSRRRVRRNEEFDNMASDRRKKAVKSKVCKDSGVDHRNHKNRYSDKYSDISESDYDSKQRGRKSKPEHIHTSRRSTSRPQQKEEISEKSNNNNHNRKSSSRHRSQPRSVHHPTEDREAPHPMDCEDDIHGNRVDNDNCDTKNCGSDCSLS